VDPDLFNLYLLALWIHIIDTDPDTERKIWLKLKENYIHIGWKCIPSDEKKFDSRAFSNNNDLNSLIKELESHDTGFLRMSSRYNSESLLNLPNPGRFAIGYCCAMAGFERVLRVQKIRRGAIWYCRVLAGFNRVNMMNNVAALNQLCFNRFELLEQGWCFYSKHQHTE
jgi:hypothetical protein